MIEISAAILEKKNLRKECKEKNVNFFFCNWFFLFLRTAEDSTKKHINMREKIRKEKREQNLKRIRRGEEQQENTKIFTKEQVKDMIVTLQKGSAEMRSKALKALRDVTESDDPHLALLFDMRIVEVLKKVLTGSNSQDQFDALWCLTNLATASHQAITQLYPVVPYMVHLLTNESPQVVDQAVWCIGNIAGDCEECRVRLAANGAIHPLLNLMKRKEPAYLHITLGFAISNMVRSKDNLETFVSKGLIAMVLQFLTPAHPMEVVVEMAWVLTLLTSGSPANKAKVMELGGVDLITQILSTASGNFTLLLPLLRVIGNLGNSPDQLVLKLINTKNLLKYLWNHLAPSDNTILKEICWALGNISGGPKDANLALVKCNFVPPLAALFNSSINAVKKDIGFIFLNMVSSLRTTTPILDMLMKIPGVLRTFVEFINMPDIEMIGMGIRWAGIVLKYYPNGKEIFEENGGLVELEDLEYNNHKSDELFRRANKLLDTYFMDNDMMDFSN